MSRDLLERALDSFVLLVIEIFYELLDGSLRRIQFLLPLQQLVALVVEIRKLVESLLVDVTERLQATLRAHTHVPAPLVHESKACSSLLHVLISSTSRLVVNELCVSSNASFGTKPATTAIRLERIVRRCTQQVRPHQAS